MYHVENVGIEEIIKIIYEFTKHDEELINYKFAKYGE